MKYWFTGFLGRGGSCLKYSSYHKSTAFLFHGATMASPLYLRFFEDTSSLGLNSFLFGLNSLNSHKETLLKAFKTFILLKSCLPQLCHLLFSGHSRDNKITGFFWSRWFPGSFPGSPLSSKDSPVVLQPNGEKKNQKKKPPKITSLSPCPPP